MSTSRVGAMFPCTTEPEALPAFARRVEALGYDELWIVEDCFYAGGVASAGAALGATERIPVGLGILPAVLRNPAAAAMDLAALARLFPGRVLPGFGHGVAAWMRQVGALPPSQLAAGASDTTTLAAELPDAWVDRLTVSGTPEGCAASIRRFHQAGSNTVVLVPPPQEPGTALQQLEHAAEHVLPALRP